MRIERVVLQRDRFIGLRRGCVTIVVRERKIGHEFMRIRQLRIELDGLRQIFRGFAVKSIR